MLAFSLTSGGVAGVRAHIPPESHKCQERQCEAGRASHSPASKFPPDPPSSRLGGNLTPSLSLPTSCYYRQMHIVKSHLSYLHAPRCSPHLATIIEVHTQELGEEQTDYSRPQSLLLRLHGSPKPPAALATASITRTISPVDNVGDLGTLEIESVVFILESHPLLRKGNYKRPRCLYHCRLLRQPSPEDDLHAFQGPIVG